MSIVDKIKSIAEDKGLKISDIEIACDLSDKTIYRWDKNKPSIDKVVKVAQYLKVDIGYLLGTTPYKTKYDEWNDKYDVKGLAKEVKKIEAVDTIAAHLEDKEITDDKVKAITAYMDLLFEKKK